MEWRRKSVNSLPIRAFPFKLRQTDEHTYLNVRSCIAREISSGSRNKELGFRENPPEIIRGFGLRALSNSRLKRR